MLVDCYVCYHLYVGTQCMWSYCRIGRMRRKHRGLSTIIYEGIDVFYEAVELLEFMASDTQPLEIKKKIMIEYGISPELLEEPFDVLAKLLEEIKKRLRTKMPLVKEYFAYYNDDNEEAHLCKGAVTLLIQYNDYAKPLDQRMETVLGMSEERRCYEFCQMIETGYQMDTDVLSIRREDCRTLRDLLECLDKSDYTPDQKWQLQWVFTHPKEAWEEVEPLVRTTMKLIEENEALWRPLVEEFCDYYRKELADRSLEEYIMSELGFDVGKNPKGRVLMPGIVPTNSISFHEGSLQREENGELLPDVCHIGMVLKRIGLGIFRNSPVDNRKHLVSLLKILADESKLEILALLKERSRYGGELAKELKLTTATISHHMGILVGYGLVTLNKEMNRVYYELDEKAIRKILDQTEELLLGKR